MRTVALTLSTTIALTLTAFSTASAQITWESSLREAHAKAQAEGKLLLLHFYSDNCSFCDRLEQGSYKNPVVGNAIHQNFVPVKVHANKSPKLAEMFKVTKFPTDVIVDTEGKTLSHSVSPQDPNLYIAMLTKTLPAGASTTAIAKNPLPTDLPSYAQVPAATPSAPAATPAAVATTTAVPAASASLERPATKPAVESKTATTPATSPAAVASTTTVPAANASFALPSDKKVDASLTSSPTTGGLSLEMPAQISEVKQDVTDATQAITNPTPSDTTKAVATTNAEDLELAMQGFCAVTVISEDRWVEGNPEFGAVHLGKLYLFTSKEKMETFLADPVPYTPVLNEIDVVRFFEERQIVPGQREWGLKDPIHNRMFFFADEAAMNHFYNKYEIYTDAAIAAMDRAIKDANPVTR
jgi:thioredoxin-related protein